ncbi:MAG: DUF4105 domain-containing protein [Deltaproteobacteria bacterium]|nr:DUF4105 domain-containing protein [Deltaproteobacteria bacterium]
MTVFLYTGGPGADAFEAFGHVALCVGTTDQPGAGTCFDYGTAYFEDFYGMMWGFLRGEAEFQVIATPEWGVLERFRSGDRTIRRLELPLTPPQQAAVIEQLWGDTSDPAWRYRYDHFSDNCATRVRDVLDRAVGGAWREATEGRPGPGESFRNLGRRLFGAHPALLLPTDLLVGRAADVVPDRWASMFLPDLLRSEAERFFGVASTVVYLRRGPDLTPDPGWGGRQWFVVLGLLLGAPLACARRAGRFPRLALAGAIVPLALLGLVVWGMSFVSTLAAVRWNEVLLVLVPFDFALLFLSERIRSIFARVRLGMLAAAALLLAVGVLRQPLWATFFLPLPTMLAIAFVRPRERSAAPPPAASPSAGREPELPPPSGMAAARETDPT